MVAKRSPTQFIFQSLNVYLYKQNQESGCTCKNMEAGMYRFCTCLADLLICLL